MGVILSFYDFCTEDKCLFYISQFCTNICKLLSLEIVSPILEEQNRETRGGMHGMYNLLHLYICNKHNTTCDSSYLVIVARQSVLPKCQPLVEVSKPYQNSKETFGILVSFPQQDQFILSCYICFLQFILTAVSYSR